MADISFLNEPHSGKLPAYLRLKPKAANTTSERILSVNPPGSTRVVLDNQKECTFDGVFGETITQIELYKNLVFPLVQNTVEGEDSLFFTIGATGSGKVSFTKKLL